MLIIYLPFVIKKKKYKTALKYLKETLKYNNEDYIAYYDVYKIYNIFIKHEKDNEKKEKYEKLSQKYLKKSADLGYDKALEILKD